MTERLELIASNEAKLEEINAELNSKMSEMVDDFDRDKQAALDRYVSSTSNGTNIRYGIVAWTQKVVGIFYWAMAGYLTTLL